MVANQQAMLVELMKDATPQNLPEKLGLMRALGIPLPANAEAELLTYLSGAIP